MAAAVKERKKRQQWSGSGRYRASRPHGGRPHPCKLFVSNISFYVSQSLATTRVREPTCMYTRQDYRTGRLEGYTATFHRYRKARCMMYSMCTLLL